MRDSVVESLIDLGHASSEIYSMAHEYLHRSLREGDIEREHTRLLELRARVDHDITNIRIALNEGKGG